MTTNQNGHTLRNLTNRVIAVIDDPQQIDAEGVYSGGVKHVLRGLQRFTLEAAHLRKYEAELGQGHHVVDVHIHGRRNLHAVAEILRTYGAHFINVYGPWTIEGVAA